MRTRCIRCQTLCEVNEGCCSNCGAQSVVHGGVDESELWNGKVRSQWPDDPLRQDHQVFSGKFTDWIERDETQNAIRIVGFIVTCVVFVITLMMSFM